MSENTIALPPHTIVDDEWGADGPLRIIAANGENGLDTKVIDVRAEAPNAFPPRTVNDRVVTDTACHDGAGREARSTGLRREPGPLTPPDD